MTKITLPAIKAKFYSYSWLKQHIKQQAKNQICKNPNHEEHIMTINRECYESHQ